MIDFTILMDAIIGCTFVLLCVTSHCPTSSTRTDPNPLPGSRNELSPFVHFRRVIVRGLQMQMLLRIIRFNGRRPPGHFDLRDVRPCLQIWNFCPWGLCRGDGVNVFGLYHVSWEVVLAYRIMKFQTFLHQCLQPTPTILIMSHPRKKFKINDFFSSFTQYWMFSINIY